MTRLHPYLSNVINFVGVCSATAYLTAAYHARSLNPAEISKVSAAHIQRNNNLRDEYKAIRSFLFEPQWNADLNRDGIWSFSEQAEVYRLATGDTNKVFIEGLNSIAQSVFDLPPSNLQKAVDVIKLRDAQ